MKITFIREDSTTIKTTYSSAIPSEKSAVIICDSDLNKIHYEVLGLVFYYYDDEDECVVVLRHINAN